MLFKLRKSFWNSANPQSPLPQAKSTKNYIGTYDQAHELHKENQHIRRGYRINYHDISTVFRSLFEAHNQTVNIWTHIIGVIIVAYLIFQGIANEMESHALGKALIKDFIAPFSVKSTNTFYQTNSTFLSNFHNKGLEVEQISSQLLQSQARGGQLASWPITVSLISAAISLSCSVFYHLIHPLSEKTFKISLGLDFAGVGINMAFAPIPIFYYSMYCNQTTRNLYIGLIALGGMVNFTSSIIVLFFNINENKMFKMWKLSFSCLVCCVGLAHLLINQLVFGNYGDTYSVIPSSYFIFAALVCYAFGFLFYASRCPERYHPGKYDICGHSHQIWHSFVVFGIVFAYFAFLICYQMRSYSPVCPRNF